MRKQIAAANWKMNLTYQQGEKLLDDILEAHIELAPHQQVIFAVPFPYLIMAKSEVADNAGYDIAAQNCNDKQSGAYTGEVSAEMLQSIGIEYCVVGHSERREYYLETNKTLADKVNICLQNNITPIFCCGEALSIRGGGGRGGGGRRRGGGAGAGGRGGEAGGGRRAGRAGARGRSHECRGARRASVSCNDSFAGSTPGSGQRA